jgi:hypothetical protein
MIILLITHITAALTSFALTAVAYIWPSRLKLRVDLILAGLTLATGIYLVWTNPKDLVSATVSGVTYLAIVLAGILAAHRKLVRIDETA